MSKREESELQIELTKLQIEHEKEVLIYSITISFLFSLSIALIVFFFSLSVTFNATHLAYWGYAIFVVLQIVGVLGITRLQKTNRELDSEIEKLKKKYLW